MLLMFSKYFTAAKDLDLNKVALGEYVRTPPLANAGTRQNQDRSSRSSSDSYILALSNSDAATLNDRQRTSVSIASGSNFALVPLSLNKELRHARFESLDVSTWMS